MKVERISAQAFRGYLERADVVLEGDVILIYGENGSGKTSLTEAFEYALFGTMVRKTRSKTPGEYRGAGWIRNAHSPEDLTTFAEVLLKADDGKSYVVRRELDGVNEKLTINGKVETDVGDLGIPLGDAFRPFLGQCEIQGLIDSEQQNRWEQLSAILGFGEFGRARQRLQRLRTDADHEERVKNVREIATRVVQPLTPQGEDPLKTYPDTLRERAASFLELPNSSDWSSIEMKASTEIHSLLKGGSRPTGLDRMLVGPKDLDSAVEAINSAAKSLIEDSVAHREWHENNLRSAFAGSGLRLIDEIHPKVCPFCASPTLTDTQVDAMRLVAEQSDEKPPSNREAFEQCEKEIRSEGPVDEKVLAGLREALVEGSDKTLLEQIASEQEDLEQAKKDFSGLAQGVLSATTSASEIGADSKPLENLVKQLATATFEISGAYSAIRVSAEQLQASLAKQFASLNEKDNERLTALQKAKLLAENSSSVLSAWRISELQTEVEATVGRLEELEKASMNSALSTLSDDAARYYEEMSPGQHISDIGIKVRQNSKRRQAALEAKSHGKTVNPITTFSEAEGNCLGLSLYFSQRVDRNKSWSMIMLDDPFQSMDKGHEQGLIRVLAEISKTRQIILMTHSRSFEDDVSKQFRPLAGFQHYRTLKHDGPGPKIEVVDGRFPDLVAYAEQNSSGSEIRRESAAGALRKAVERFCREFARKNNKELKRGSTSVTTLVGAIKDFGIDDLDRGTLDRIAKFGTRNAHEDHDANTSQSAILTNAKSLRELGDRYLADV